jgi:drug/metabolite transporter (DMT)-like permease
MDIATFFVILAGASATALLNCALRHRSDPLAAALLLSVGGGIVAIPVLYITGLPDMASAPYLVSATVLACLYWIFIGKAYASGEVGTVFPLAYGAAPALVLLASSLLVQEYPTTQQIIVIVLISCGLFLVLFSGTNTSAFASRTVLLNCLAVMLVIAGYTINDALGARVSGNPFAYTAFLYITGGISTAVYGLLFQKHRLARALPDGWQHALFWGAASLAIYSGELWAMTRAPIALVAALRESSILFAALFAIIWLKEPIRTSRVAGAGVVALGLMMMRLA